MTARQKLHPAVAELDERELSLEEWKRDWDVPHSEQEDADVLDLVRWFTTRYPTAKERFAYVNRKYKEWTRTRDT
jgi:hypothetical protein